MDASDTNAASAPKQRRARGSGDGKVKRGPRDATRIAMSENYEVRYWTEKFDVSPAELQRAVDAVGNGAAMVDQYLTRKKTTNAA